MAKVYILRGISGSGKTTYILNNFPEALVCSADHFFMKDGQYVFDQKLLGKAHQYCFRTFIEAIQSKAPLICVDNTNTSAWQISPYYIAAETFGYDVEIIELNVDPEVAAKRNLHGATDRIIKGMLFPMKQALPKIWKLTKVSQ